MARIGIDIGGTGIQVGLIDGNSKIISESSIPTRTDLPFEEQVRQIAECVISTAASAGMNESDIEMVGVGIPGIASDETGEIIKCTNMGWAHVPFRDEFVKTLNKPVLIDNDANVAALAESVAGISAGTSSSVFITIGTGIGSGIIIIGGEQGHVILGLGGVPCTCGNHGCLERYCSATAVIRMAREAAKEHPETMMLKAVANEPSKIEAKTVFDCAKQNDPAAVDVYNTYIDYLSQEIASVINLLDPEVIVLGGGVSKAGSFLLDPIVSTYPKYVIFRDMPMPEVRLAVLGSKAGIIGAAMLS